MKTNKSSGKISKILLILAVVLLVVIVVVYVIVIGAVKKKSQTSPTNSSSTSSIPEKPEPPKPVYEATIQDVKFLFISAKNLGSVLKARSQYEKDLNSTERFIKVTVGAQNKGKNNLPQYSWDIGNIVDSEGRNFIPDNRAYYFLPKPDLCGAILKPEFKYTPCVKIYEVSKQSKDLKIEVKTNNAKQKPLFLDLKITY